MLAANNETRPQRARNYPVILLTLALLAYAVIFSWQAWSAAKADEAGRLAALAELGEKAVDSYLGQVEVAMQGLGIDLSGERQQLDVDRAFVLLRRFQKLHPELGNVLLLRADGQILLTGNTRYSSELPTLADDPAFIRFRDELQRGTSFLVDQPVLGHIDHSWVIPARHGIADQTGKLTHILSANLPIDMLQRYWVDSSSPRIAVLGLLRDDGYLLCRYPEADAARMDRVYGQPLAGTMVEYLRAQNFPQRGQVEGQGSTVPDMLMVMRRLQHYPLTLFVEMPRAEIRSAWWRRVQIPYVLMALMLAGILLGYNRSKRPRQAWSLEQRREAARLHYEQALLEHSQNEILIFDADTLQFTFANDYALNNLGYSLEEIKQITLLSLHPELGIESFARLVEPLRRGGQDSVTYQTVQARAQGSIYPVEVKLQMVSSGDRNGYLAIIHDISALRQAEENLAKFNAPVERRDSRSKSRLADFGAP